MLRCKNGKLEGYETENCFEGLHFLYAFLSVLVSAVFYFLIMLLNIFYFNPFNANPTSTKVNTTADTFLFIFKIMSVIRLVALNNDWLSIIVLFLGSISNLKRAYENPTYNNNMLESV